MPSSDYSQMPQTEESSELSTESLAGATIAITGGTGSFGKTMAGHLLAEGAAFVHILSRDEAKQDDMRKQFGDSRLKFFLGDIRDRSSVDDAFANVDFVFHAAALKQVPSCEFFPQQAVQTNILGSQNVLEAAAHNGVQSLVCLSTDKAVYPVNAMGMTKALMEKMAQAFSRNNPKSRTTVSTTRYGNVMYSRGSVIPLFFSLLKQGKPLTITDSDMTRFLMSLEESVDLVKHAFFNANPGDLFVRKAPASTVEVLAKAVASLYGESDPALHIIGTRHGEKQHETLLSSEEMAKATDQGDFYRVPLDGRSLEYEQYYEEGNANVTLFGDYTSENTKRLDLEATKELLLTLPDVRAQLESQTS